MPHRNWRFRKPKSKKEIIRRKADKLLQEYIRAKHKGELCWVCGERLVTVGHHFISKKNSLALRFYIPNIIPICKECHSLVHCQPHLVEPKICFKLGTEWYEDLMETKRQGVKFNLEWIETQYKILEEIKSEVTRRDPIYAQKKDKNKETPCQTRK
jgi:5-methylcytosine-specific restriction endonuclease McrA